MLLPILQATQNRNGAALHAKIDELIKASGKARDDLIRLENRGEDEIEQIRVDEGQRAKATGNVDLCDEHNPGRAQRVKRSRVVPCHFLAGRAGQSFGEGSLQFGVSARGMPAGLCRKAGKERIDRSSRGDGEIR